MKYLHTAHSRPLLNKLMQKKPPCSLWTERRLLNCPPQGSDTNSSWSHSKPPGQSCSTHPSQLPVQLCPQEHDTLSLMTTVFAPCHQPVTLWTSPKEKPIASHWTHKITRLVKSEECCICWKGTCKSKVFLGQHAVHALGQRLGVRGRPGDGCAQNHLATRGWWEIWSGAHIEPSLLWWTRSPQFFVKWRHCRNL